MEPQLGLKILASVVCLLGLGAAVSGQEPVRTSPAERRIVAAEKGIRDHPEKYQFHNDLALALTQRVREISDPGYYDRAEQALQQSFRLSPANFEGQKLEVLLLLARHEYAKAGEKARVLNKRAPDDVLVWGYIADADLALGDYDDAEGCAQWMLDLRPGNTPGLIRGARLRALYGDFDGAADYLKQAYLQTPPNEVEDQAWFLSELAELELTRGKPEEAEKLLKQALQLFPGYTVATLGMARVRIAQQKFTEAIDLLQQVNRRATSPQGSYVLAEALERAGRSREALATYKEFEERAREKIGKAGNADRELIFYYAGHARKPAEALRIARLEIAQRHDVDTLDAYAWALYVNSHYAEARKELDKVLALGVRNAAVFYHAGAVASALHDRAAAVGYFKQSLDLNPFSEIATAAREALDGQAPTSATLGGRQ